MVFGKLSAKIVADNTVAVGMSRIKDYW